MIEEAIVKQSARTTRQPPLAIACLIGIALLGDVLGLPAPRDASNRPCTE